MIDKINLGLSRSRVTQILNLLKLDLSIIEELENLGELMDGRIVTERKLRGILKYSKIK